MRTCQILIVLLSFAGFLINIYYSIHGRKAQEPLGFTGVVISMGLQLLFLWLYYKAGALSTFFPQ